MFFFWLELLKRRKLRLPYMWLAQVLTRCWPIHVCRNLVLSRMNFLRAVPTWLITSLDIYIVRVSTWSTIWRYFIYKWVACKNKMVHFYHKLFLSTNVNISIKIIFKKIKKKTEWNSAFQFKYLFSSNFFHVLPELYVITGKARLSLDS